MTTHYHGGPLWGGDELLKALYRNTGALISYARPDQIKKIAEIRCKLVLDNGAFSTWRNAANDNNEVLTQEWWRKHWEGYYDFVGEWFSRIEWFIIPDVIEGTEQENDALIEQVPAWLMNKAVPVWHSDESIERFVRLCERFPRVAIGCCGPHRSIRSAAWKKRMTEAFNAIYVERSLPVKIHGLRMLDGRALSQFPFDSADSTNVAINVPKTKARLPNITDKLHRTAIMRHTIEMVKPPTVNEWMMAQNDNTPLLNWKSS